MAEQIFRRLQSAFVAVFGRDVPIISARTTARDIKRWDSLTHLNLILAIEEEFGTTFDLNEIRGFRNVGDVADLLRLRLAGKGRP